MSKFIIVYKNAYIQSKNRMGRLYLPTLNFYTRWLDYKYYIMNSVMWQKQKYEMYLTGNILINVWNERERHLNKQIKTCVLCVN